MYFAILLFENSLQCTKSRHLEIQIRKHFSDPLPTPYLPRRLRCFDPRAMALELGAVRPLMINGILSVEILDAESVLRATAFSTKHTAEVRTIDRCTENDVN